MKVEKDNAMDKSDVCEVAAKEAKLRACQAEEEVAELVKKAQQLEVELDKTQNPYKSSIISIYFLAKKWTFC